MPDIYELIEQVEVIRNLKQMLIEENKGVQIIGYFPEKGDIAVLRVVDRETYKAVDYLSVTIDGRVRETKAPIKEKTVVSQYAELDGDMWFQSEKYKDCETLSTKQRPKRPKGKVQKNNES